MANLIFVADIPGYEGEYGITEEGDVYSLRYNRFLKPYIITKGYLGISLCKDCIKISMKIHRLVAEKFIPNPDNLPQVDHIDRNKRNNNVSNLRWATNKQNSANRGSMENTKSQYKGVALNVGKWEAKINVDQKAIYLGRFENEIDAAIAYNNGVDRYYPNSNFHYKNEV